MSFWPDLMPDVSILKWMSPPASIEHGATNANSIAHGLVRSSAYIPAEEKNRCPAAEIKNP